MTFVRQVLATVLYVTLFSIAASHAADFPPITPDELKMTSIPEQPGAPAVILLREETDDDMNNVHTVYERIKVLTDAGREYANVELPYSKRGFSIGGISGRTVHSDGTSIPFTGKAFDKPIIRSGQLRYNVKSFTLPDVQVGSIIDFRYSLRYDDNIVLAPEWEVQNELFQRKAYFKFIPFQNHGNAYVVLSHGRVANGVAWTPFLGVAKQPEIHHDAAAEASYANSAGRATMWVDLNLENIPALVTEPQMPPRSLLRWRVYFYYQETLKPEDYWKEQGKWWHKDVEGFLDRNEGIGQALNQIVAPSDTPEQKVRKIYAFVSQLENQDYIPARTSEENKILNLKINKGAADVLAHRSGTHDELNRLFVSMVRAAGIPASLIWVPDRSHDVFLKQYLSTQQLDAEIAIVQLDGKDVFLDPGTKFCPYGILDWRYTAVDGLRLAAKGAEFGQTPVPRYRDAVRTRLADLSLLPDGTARGLVALVFKGTEAMLYRQKAGKTDADGRKKMLEDELRAMLPGNSEVKLTIPPNWDNAEIPLTAQFQVSFPFAVASGKTLLLEQHLFQSQEKNRFPASQRISGIYFRYPWQEADEVHITVPAGLEVESLAPDDTVKLDYALYEVRQKLEAPNRLFSRRDFIMGQSVLLASQYPQVKGFFDKVKMDDDQPALLKAGANVARTQ